MRFIGKLPILLLSAIIIFTITASGQSNDPLINALVPSNNRFIVNLSGKWECSFNESDWFTTNVPSSAFDKKKVYFRRTIKIDKNLNQKYAWQIYFLGLDDQVEIYLNEQFVGKHLGSLTPFTVTIPNRMIYNETNTIKLVVSSAVDAAKKIKEQNLYAKKINTGIIRDLLLIGTNKIWVSDVKYKYNLKPDNTFCNIKAMLKISSTSIMNFLAHSSMQDSLNALGLSKTNITVDIAIKNKQTNQIVANHPPQNIDIEQERTIPVVFNIGLVNPSIWSVEFPNLYEMQIKLSKNGQVFDDYSVNIGFHSIYKRVMNGSGQILLNGNPFEIKGVDYVEDYWKNGQTLSLRRMEQDIALIKTLGANTIRFKYNSPHPYFLYLCDKYGLYAFIDLPVYDVPRTILELDEIQVRMKNIADRLYSAYDNNVSVLAWGILDGVHEENDDKFEFEKSLISLLRYNSSKLIYKNVLFGSKSINTSGYDFIGLSDNRKLKTSEDIKNELYRLKGILNNVPAFVHYGQLIQPNNHNGYSDQLSLEAQAYYILNLFHIVRDKQFSGSIINSFNDFELQNPLMTINNDNLFLCSSGLMDRARQQRLSYTTLQALFNNEKEPLLNAGSYSEKTPVVFIGVGLALLLIVIFLANRFKRFREYLFRAALRPYNFYADIRDQRIISSVQTIMLGFVLAVTLGVYISSILFFFRSSETAQLIITLFVPFFALKEFLFQLIWMPELLLVLCSIYFFALIFLTAFVIKIFSFFVRGKIFYTDTLMITIWSGTPIILLLPVSVILIRMLIFMPGIIWLANLALILVWIWVLLRTLRSTAVVFDVLPAKVYGFGLGLLGLFYILLFSFYQYQFSIFSYLSYLIKIINS